MSKLQMLLTPRDVKILQSIFDHRFLTTRQICRLHFWDHASYGSAIRACTRVLTRLHGHRLIYRLERPIGGNGGGSSSNVWGIDAAGDRLMKSANAETGKRSRSFEPSPLFLMHTLAVSEVRVELEELARTNAIELVRVTTEPHNWRYFLGRSGSTVALKPDLFAVTALGEYEDFWFIEVDRGTESIPTLIKKCVTYQRYHDGGDAQRKDGVFPLVLWLIPTDSRRQRFADAIEADDRLDPEIFRIIDPGLFQTQITDPSERRT